MVGGAMALDLALNHQVLLVDLKKEALEKIANQNQNISTLEVDISNKLQLEAAVAQSELVIGAVPGFLGYQLLDDLIDLKKNVVDISFCPENAMNLQQKAVNQGVTVVVDAGVAPGLSNLFLGHFNEKLELSNFKCMVGGLPKNRIAPWEYKAPFSPIDVIEEYTRPARFKRDGELVCMDALTEIEEVHINGLKLEAFNSDGLRTILDSFPNIPNLVEKTLRYPGHAAKILNLKSAGMFSDDPIAVGDKTSSALEITEAVLLKSWKLEEGEAEFTIMKMDFEGRDKSTKMDVRRSFVLYDEYDPKSNTSSMARTTGYTATALANLLLEQDNLPKGIVPLERVGQNEQAFNYILSYLANRNVKIEEIEA